MADRDDALEGQAVTLGEIAAAARAEGMSYAQYVARYDKPKQKEKSEAKEPVKYRCTICGKSLDKMTRPNIRKYCGTCADEQRRIHSRMAKARRRVVSG